MSNIIIDSHIHTNNSRDAFHSIASMCNEAFKKGVDIIKRFKQLGGEFITVGSDAHKP